MVRATYKHLRWFRTSYLAALGTEGEGWFAFPKITGENKQRFYASVLFTPRSSKPDWVFIWSLMKLAPRDRPTGVELLNHEWLVELGK